MNNEVGSVYVSLNLDDKEFKSGLKDAGRKIKDFSEDAGDKLKSFGNQTKQLGVSMIAFGAGITAIGVASIKSYMETEQVLKRTETVLNSTGKSATITAQSVADLASSFQRVTQFSDEAIQSGINVLLRFDSIGKETMPIATQAMLDFAAATGKDVPAAALTIARAFEDPERGMMLLRRQGVLLTEQQQELVRQFIDTGNQAGAQQIILEALSKSFGGAAKAAGETFAGKLEILKNQIDEIRETIGKELVDALSKFITKLLPIVEKLIAWAEQNPKLILTIVAIGAALVALGGLLVVIGTLAGALGNIITILGALGVSLGTAAAVVLGVGAAIAALIAVVVVLWKNWDKVKEAVGSFVERLNAAYAEIQPVINAIGAMFAAVFNGIITVLTPVIQFMKDAFTTAWTVIYNVFSPFAEFFIGLSLWLFDKTFKPVLQRLRDAFAAAWNWIRDNAGTIAGIFTGIVSGISSALANVYEAITKPFRQAFDWLRKESEKVKKALDKINPFHRESPSLIDWINRGTDVITKSYGSMFDKLSTMSAEIRPQLAETMSGNVSNSSVSTSIYGNINIANQNDADYLLSRISYNDNLVARGLSA